MEQRLIEATKLQGEMMDMIASGLYGLEDMIDAVIEQPTVDAVPVVHGEWVEKWRFKPNGNPYHKVGDMECSVCHSDMLGRYYSRYCPHCGARMDGERKDGERKDDE